MPHPERGESFGDYLHRFMRSGEATHDFPKRKQRYAVARSLFKRKKKGK